MAATPAGGEPTSEPAGSPFSSFGYGETDVRGLTGRADLFFALPPGVKPGGETFVDLDVSHSPLLLARSTLTVLAGGVSLASGFLTPANASHGRMTARVPAELFGPTGLSLSIRTYLRLTDDECEDPANPALWATVHGSSTVQLGLQRPVRNLDDAAAVLTGAKAAGGVSLAFPESPDAETLKAAGVAASQVGRWYAERGSDSALVGLAAGASDTTGPSVTLAAGSAPPAGFPVSWTGGAYALEGREVAAGRGVLAMAQDGSSRLLVAGATPGALVEAVEALDTVRGGGAVALTGERVAPVTDDAAPWHDGAASFAQLGIGAQEVDGLGGHEITLMIDRPPGWAITGHPRLDLVVDSAATLDLDRSSIQVQLAGSDLGSRRIQRGDGPHTYAFDIPPGLIDRRLDGRAVRSLELTVRFVLEATRMRCQPFDVEAARAVVLPTSAIRLPHETFEGRELGRFPHPLAVSQGPPVVVVLPNAPTADALAAGLQVCAALGRWSEPGAAPPLLTTADHLDPTLRKANPLVLLGDADTQVSGAPIDVGSATLLPGPDDARAVMGLVPSPFDTSRSALVIHGDGPGLLLAARTLSSRKGLEALRGSRVSLVGPRPTTLADVDGAGPPPELAPVLGGRSFVAENSWALPAVVLLAGFLVALVLLARARWFSGRRRAT